MEGACSMHGRCEKSIQSFGWKIYKEKTLKMTTHRLEDNVNTHHNKSVGVNINLFDLRQ